MFCFTENKMNDDNAPGELLYIACAIPKRYICYFCGTSVQKITIFCDACDELEWNKGSDPEKWPDVLKYPKRVIEL